MFSCEFCEICKNTFFTNHLRWLLKLVLLKPTKWNATHIKGTFTNINQYNWLLLPHSSKHIAVIKSIYYLILFHIVRLTPLLKKTPATLIKQLLYIMLKLPMLFTLRSPSLIRGNFTEMPASYMVWQITLIPTRILITEYSNRIWIDIMNTFCKKISSSMASSALENLSKIKLLIRISIKYDCLHFENLMLISISRKYYDLSMTYPNPFKVNFLIIMTIQKPANQFTMRINWLTFIWWEDWPYLVSI